MKPDGNLSIFGKFTDSLKTRRFKVGTYSIAVTLVVIAIAVVINVFAARIPPVYTKLDFTSLGLYKLSEQTEEIVRGLDRPLDIYWITQTNREDQSIEMLLDRYLALNSDIRLEKVDPILNPGFSKQYTEETVYENSLIIVNGDVSEYVAYNEIYLYDFSTYYYDGNYTVDFDGERAVTRAIDYVTNEHLPTLYYLTGHGEAVLEEARILAINKQNIIVKELSLISVGGVPNDADAILINNPTSDLSDIDKGLLMSYVEAGGNLLVYTDFVAASYPHFTEVMQYFGVSPNSGIVFDSDPDHCALGYIYYLLPDIAEHPITAPLLQHDYRVISPLAHVIDTTYTPGLTTVELLMTSGASYSKAFDNSESFDKEEGDAEGPFTIGVAVTAGEGTENEARLVWYSSASMMSDTADSIVSGANRSIFINSIGWLCQKDSAISIHAKSLDTAHLRVSGAAVNQLGLLFIGVVPLVFILMGLVVFLRRRRK